MFEMYYNFISDPTVQAVLNGLGYFIAAIMLGGFFYTLHTETMKSIRKERKAYPRHKRK